MGGFFGRRSSSLPLLKGILPFKTPPFPPIYSVNLGLANKNRIASSFSLKEFWFCVCCVVFLSCWVHCWEKVCKMLPFCFCFCFDLYSQERRGASESRWKYPREAHLKWAGRAEGLVSLRDQGLRLQRKGDSEATPASASLATHSNPPRAPRAGPLGRALLETRPLREAVSLGPFTSSVVSALCLDVEKSTSENNQACSCWEAC